VIAADPEIVWTKCPLLPFTMTVTVITEGDAVPADTTKGIVKVPTGGLFGF
jgi:hypothetical protein